MFSVDLRTRSSVSGRVQAVYGVLRVWSAACSCFRLPFLLFPSLLPFPFTPSYSSVFPPHPTLLSTVCSNGCDAPHEISSCILCHKPVLKSCIALRWICHSSDNGAGFSATIWVSPVTSDFTSDLYSFKPAAPRD